MIVLPVLGMMAVHPFIFELARPRGVFVLGVIRQRQHGLREGRVVVAVLDPAIALDDEIAHPACGRRRLLGKVQRHFVAGIHDDVAVIDLGNKLANIAVACVVADQVAPVLLGSFNLVVVRDFRRARAHRHVHYGIAAIVQIGDCRIQSRFLQRRVRRALRPVDGVPVNFQIRAQPHPARRSGAEDIGQIEQDRLLAARGKAQVVLRRDPAAAAVGHFDAHAVGAPAIALGDGDIHR